MPTDRRPARDVRVYYKAATDDVPAILDRGLRYDPDGGRRDEPRVRRADAFLDERRPPSLAGRGVARARCVHGYLFVDGMVHDTESGELVPLTWWDAGAQQTLLRLHVDPAAAWVGDLDLYDRVAGHLANGAHVTRPGELASRYWRRLVDLRTLAAHYRPVGKALVCDSAAARGLPARLDRVEVLVASAVSPDAVEPAAPHPSLTRPAGS